MEETSISIFFKDYRKLHSPYGLVRFVFLNVFREVEKLWVVFNAEKKLFNPAQGALTKIPRNEAKVYQKSGFSQL